MYLIPRRPISWSKRIAVFALLISFCANTSFAAPDAMRTIVVSAGEIGQDIRFGYMSSSLGTAVGGWASNLLLFFRTKQDTSQLSRIEIIPGGDITVRQGEPSHFTALGYTADGIPVSGLKFNWTVQDAGRQLKTHNLPSGTFPANALGSFTITANTEGYQAQVNVTVEENQPLMMMKRIKEKEARGDLSLSTTLKGQNQYSNDGISSKADYRKSVKVDAPVTQETVPPDTVGQARSHGPNATDAEPENKDAVSSRSKMIRRAADVDGWSNSNWWMADDPGNQPGNPPGASPDAGAGNGNFQFSAPVVSLPGRGIDLSLSLNYNSRVWSKGGSVMSFDAERGSPAPGWNLGFGKMMFMGTSGGCMLIDADGTNHGYTGTVSTYTYGSTSSTIFAGHTTDGTLIDYNCSVSTYSGVTTMSGDSSLPNGTKVYFYVPSANGKQAFPTQIWDAQGNYINITYRSSHGPQLNTVTDTMGRVITFNYDSLDRLISVDVPKMAAGGTRTAVRLHYKQITLNPGWASGTTGDTNNATPYVVDAIYYPGTSTGYWFGADSGASDYATYYSSYGMLAKVIEQRGMGWSGTAGTQGTVSAGTMSKQAVYNYPLSPDYTLTDAPTYSTLTESWDGMDTSAAVTSYSINMSSSPRTITVTQPTGLQSKQYMYNASGLWNDGLIYQDQTLDASNVQLSKSVVTWAQGAYDSPRPTETDITDEQSHVLKTTYAYGTSYNQLTSQKIYDYDGTTLLKEARNTYENNAVYTGRHVFSLVKTAEIYDGAGTRVGKTDYEYDNNAVVNGTGTPNLKAATGVTMHYDSYDPFTTELTNGDCIAWDYSDPYDPYGSQYCTEYAQVSIYDPSAEFRGNLTKTTGYADAATPAGSIAQTKQYDITGNLVAESASCCELKTYDYTSTTQYAYPTTQTRGSSVSTSTLRNTTTALFDFNTGLVTQATDPNGRTSTTTYSADTLRPSLSTSSTGAYSQKTYDESAMTITNEVKDASAVTAGKNIAYLNGLGQVKHEDSVGPSGVTDIVQTTYNQLAQPWKQSRPYRTGDTPQYSEKFYDIQGRIIKIVEPDASETKAYYNETARPDSASALYGATIRVMDAWGRERWGRYDAQDRLAEVVEPDPGSSGSVYATNSLSTKYTYDTSGQLTQSDQGGQLRKFKYDSLGRLTRQKLAEQTATISDAGCYVATGCSGPANWSGAVTHYDDRSNVTQRIDARGVQINYSYQLSGADDPLSRIQSISYDLSGTHDGSKPIAAAPTVSYEYMTTGDQDRLKKVTSASTSTDELTYDTEGRVADETKTFLSRSSYPMVTSNTYDTLSRVKEVRNPAQYGLAGSPRKLIQNTFDVSSRLTTLKVDGVQQAGDLVYNASDQTTSMNVGTSGTNQINEQYTFDSQTGLLTNQKAIKNGSTTLLDLSYDYARNNSNGSLSGKTGHLTKILNNLDHNKDREYQFDAIGRLTVAKGKASSQWTQTYVYDRYGNRTSVTATGTAADSSTMPTDGIPTLTFNAASNQITTSGFEYDVAGNQTRALAADGVTFNRFEYDAANRLVNIMPDTGTTPIQSQQFGVGNERISLTDYVSNQITYFCGSTEYTEFSASGVLVWSRSLVYLGDSVLSTITPNGTGGEYVEFNHPDRLGERLVTNQAGGTSYEQAHLPFGKALNAESTVTTNSKRFTSYERSARTELDYAQNRTYDSKQGKFTQVDPLGMGSVSLAAPQTLNLYAYGANDPINHVDPSGLGFFSFLKSLFKWVIAIIAVIVAVLTIIAAPAALAGILGAISASAAAGSSVMNALGYTMAAKILGWIAIATGIGAGFAAAGSANGLIIKNFASTATTTTSIWQTILGGISAASALGNALAKTAGLPDCSQNPVFKGFVAFFNRSDIRKLLNDTYLDARMDRREYGGLTAITDKGQVESEAYEVPQNSGNAEMLGFNKWAFDKLDHPRSGLNYRFWYHAHWYDKGTPGYTATGSGTLDSPELPSDSDINLTGAMNQTTKADMNGIIVSAHLITLFNHHTSCTIAR